MSDESVTKCCSKCNVVKPVCEFHKDKSKPDGLRAVCKACTASSNQAYRQSEAGRQSKKEAAARYRKSETGKQARRRYKKGAAGKAASKRYRETDHGREAIRLGGRKYYHSAKGQAKVREYYQQNKERFSEYQQEYRQSETGRESARRRAARERQKYPERIKARRAVRDAIRDGILPKPSELICRRCGNQADQYHHHISYDETHWLDVIPVCGECHQTLHATNQ